MQKGGIDTDSAIKTGSLDIISKYDSYLKQGFFEPESMLHFLKETVDSAKAEGYKALRATGEATWLVHNYPGVERFMEYEAKLNNFCLENDILAVCQYNSSRIPPDIILNCIHTHPIVMHGDLVCKNAYYIPPEKYLKPNQKEIEVNRFLYNITKNEQTEASLQKANSLLSSVIESPDNVIIFVLDQSYNYLGFNTAHVREMKRVYDVDIEIGQNIFSSIPREDDRLKAEENYIRVLKGERFVKIEQYGLQNSRFWYELVFNPIYDNLHHVTGFTVFATDITRRKKAEEQVLKLSHAIDQSSSTIVITDTKGKIEFANPRFAELTGYTIAEAIGKNPRVLKSGKTPSKVYEELWSTIKSGKEWKGEFCNSKKNGDMYWESASISPVKDDRGVIINYIAVKDDITEQKMMENALIQSEKLKSLGTITAGISHEFNNLLAIISGHVELLEEAYKDDKVLINSLSTIMKAADDGAEISTNMLKFTKTEQDTKEFESFDITSLISQAISFTIPRWKNEAQARGINYIMDQRGITSVPCMMCNPTEIREIFINMINNSLDAMTDGGSISFSTRGGDSTVFIDVTDTGLGMSEDVKNSVFDPFYSTKGLEGTGLGMSTVYGIVTRHGGKIDVASEIGKGTTFSMQFPTTHKVRSSIETPDTEQMPTVQCLRILTVDDEDAIRNMLDKFLSNSGHKVKTVDNGADAINMIESEYFDLVLCDLAMPNVFGYDVVKVLNGLKNRPKIGIITGWNWDRSSYKNMQVDFYLRKPFKFTKLVEHINEVFDMNGG